MVGLLSSYAPGQYDCFSQHKKYCVVILSRYNIKVMLVVVAFALDSI
jgi:hypothetical protein